MEYKKTYLMPAAVFAFGLIIIVAVDFLIRHFQGLENNLGFSETIWFSLHVSIVCFATFLFWKNTSQKTLPSKIGHFAPLALIFIILYTLIVYGYVIATEIDGP